jgi:predicted ATPase
VGRGRELTALCGALSRQPAVVLVEGEAGIGKSRLVREFLTSPDAQRHRSLVAVCPPFRQPYTLGAVVDALRQATDSVAGLGLSALAGALRPLFPEWAADLPPMPEPVEDATASRHRLFRALVELLDCLEIALLVVEDVHWADDATLEFLLFLVSRQPQQVNLVVSYRPEDVAADSLLLRLTSRIPVDATALRLTLEPLDVTETEGLVSSMFSGAHVSMQFAAFLHQHTGGIPLAVEESVRLMYDRADLARRDGAWVRHRLENIVVPPTIRDAVLERARRLDPDAHLVVRSGAVIAEPADDVTLLAVTGLPDGRGQAGLAEAARAMNFLGHPFGNVQPAAVHLRWLQWAADAAPAGTPGERLRLLVDRITALLLLGEETGWTEAQQIPPDATTPEDRRPDRHRHGDGGPGHPPGIHPRTKLPIVSASVHNGGCIRPSRRHGIAVPARGRMRHCPLPT